MIHPIDEFNCIFLQTIVIWIRNGRYDLCLLREGNQVFWCAIGKHFMVSKMYDFSGLSISFYKPLFPLLLLSIYVASHLLHYLFSSWGYLDIHVYFVVLDLFLLHLNYLCCWEWLLIIILILCVLCYVLKAAAQWKPLENYNYNKEEINKVDTILDSRTCIRI